jgi:hypothetical protein
MTETQLGPPPTVEAWADRITADMAEMVATTGSAAFTYTYDLAYSHGRIAGVIIDTGHDDNGRLEFVSVDRKWVAEYDKKTQRWYGRERDWNNDDGALLRTITGADQLTLAENMVAHPQQYHGDALNILQEAQARALIDIAHSLRSIAERMN